MEDAISVSELYIYPLKSCKGISVQSAGVCSTGFEWDRQWMVVNDKGRMLTQRVEPQLALVTPSLEDTWLRVEAPEMEILRLPLNKSEKSKKMVNVSVWNWSGVAMDEGATAENWFSKFLQRSCRLVKFDPEATIRITEAKYADGYRAAFSDGYPFLLTSEASLDAINQRLETQIQINRFRPNILVKGCEAFAEDRWHSFSIGELKFHGVKLCSRCKVPNIDQETGEVGTEPELSLRTFRKGERLSGLTSVKNQVYFGQNAVCEESKTNLDRGVISIGDKIVLTQMYDESKLSV